MSEQTTGAISIGDLARIRIVYKMIVRGKSQTIKDLMNQGLNLNQAQARWEEMSRGARDVFTQHLFTDSKLHEILQGLYVKCGGGQTGLGFLKLRLAEIFNQHLATRRVDKFLDDAKKDSSLVEMDQAGRDYLVHQRELIQQGQHFIPGRRVPPTISISCPACNRPLMVRPGETKTIRCKPKNGGCGFESPYPIPNPV